MHSTAMMSAGASWSINKNNQLTSAICFKGGEWTVKYGDKAQTSYSPTGDVGWSNAPTELSAMHESGNAGDNPIDLIWVSFRPGSG